MTLAAGTRLGPYEILAPIGAGGMGEVYKARDTRLDRAVAVKVLPERLSANPDLRQRFEREAKAISALAHRNICTLHDIGTEGDVDYLIMEHLEGESLAERLAKGPLPPDLAVRCGIEIADALGAAHRNGIVHRDLKPGNIMVTKSGVKLLDFGLAKRHSSSLVDTAISQISALPTEASPNRPLTEEGTILGTFQYMAPEQLEGKEADARTDIFALGCVLYEMATGRRAFTGRSRASLIGSILKEEPPAISTIQAMTPPALDRLVQTCLAKEPEDRFQTAHDVKLQLEWIAEGGSQAGAPAVVVARRKSRERLAWVSAGVSLAAALVLGVGYVRRSPKPEMPVRFQLVLPEGMSLVQAPRISPDGRMLAFSAADPAGKSQLWIRSLESLEPRVVPGTEGAQFRPFWSPDSRYLGFIAGGKLKKVDVAGAPAQTLCDAPSGADGAWGTEGVILFDGQSTDPIRRVPASGGLAQTAVQGEDNASVGWPTFLPDGRHFLYFEFGGGGREGRIKLASLDPNEKPTTVLTADSLAQYSPPGYLLYVKEGTLVAQAFDASARKVTGEPVPIAEGMGASSSGLADFSVSANGALVYRGGLSTQTRLVWLDRSGKEISDVDKPAGYGTTALSPDGKRLALSLGDARSSNEDVWIRDLERGVTSRLTFDAGDDFAPLWSPDGRSIVFASDRKGVPSLFEKDASGAGAEREIWSSGDTLIPTDWSRDGRFLAVSRLSPKNSWDVWIFPMDGKEPPSALVETPFVDILPVFSPDGRFVAYMSNETGRFEIYVRQFPGPGGRWQVSADGGLEPHWSADGKSIYYRHAANLMVASVQTAGAFTAGIPEKLFEAPTQPGGGRNKFLVSQDGRRFLFLEPAGRERVAPMTMVLHWPSALRD